MATGFANNIYTKPGKSFSYSGNGDDTGLSKPNSNQKNIRIFPTRTEGDVCLDAAVLSRNNEHLNVEVYNTLGQKLQTMRIRGEELNNLSLHNLNKGIYLLAVKRNDEVIKVTKIIKE